MGNYRVQGFLVMLFLCLGLGACGTFQVQVEYVPPEDVQLTGAVLATQNVEVSTSDDTVDDTVQPRTVAAELGKIAYVQGSDIWVTKLNSSEPVRLTYDGHNRHPRWSSSGEWLAFLKGEYNQLWLIQADGGDASQVTPMTNVVFAWSPTDDQLAYVDSQGLEILHPGETEPTSLVVTNPTVSPPTPPPSPAEMEKTRIEDIVWGPDGDWIAYLVGSDIWKVSVETGETSLLYKGNAAEKGDVVLAGWTADGADLLFWQPGVPSASILADGTPLYALAVEGGTPREVVESVLVHQDFVTPATTNASGVAVVSGSYRATWTNKRLIRVDVGSGENVLLSPDNQAVSSPAWSPDGEQVAYVGMLDEGDLGGGEPARQAMMARRLWIVDADATAAAAQEPQPLTSDPGYRDEYPLWSADGSHILFARIDDKNLASLWMVQVPDGTPFQVAAELTPTPDWFGYYGHIGEWGELFDWWRVPGKSSAEQERSASDHADDGQG